MFIADNSIFKSIMQNFLSQINSAEGVLPNDEFWKKIHFTVFKISVKCNFDGQTLIKCDFLESRLLKYFFRKCVPLVVSKLYTKFQMLSLIVKSCHPRTSLRE